MRAGILAAALFLACQVVMAHDIPVDVTVQALVKPVDHNLHLIIRVPLKAMRDVEFPEQGPGYLDLDRIDTTLHEAATLWIAKQIEIYEGDVRLPDPRVVETRVSLESDRSFMSYDEALAHVTGPRLPRNTQVFWDQAMLDVLFDYPIHSDQSRFSVPCDFSRRTAPCAHLNSSAIPASFDSIRVGIRPPCDSSDWDFFTSWMERTICCSCFAWSSRSGVFAHSYQW